MFIKTLHRLISDMKWAGSRDCAAADEVNYLDVITIMKNGGGPLVAAHDAVVEFDRDPRRLQREHRDERLEAQAV